MKPRNDKEAFMARWANTHRGISLQQQRHAQKHLFNDVVLRAYKTCYCTNCRHTWKSEAVGEAKCPNCGKTLKVLEHSKSTLMRAYYSVYTTTRNLQVCKWYVVDRKVGRGYDNYNFTLVGMEFIDENGKLTSVELPRNPMSYIKDQWCGCNGLEVRQRSFFRKYIGCTESYHQRITPKLKRNGFDYRVDNVFTMMALLSNATFESIYKCGHLEIIRDIIHRMTCDYWTYDKCKVSITEAEKVVVKLANRKHIVFDEPDMWRDMQDYLNDLMYLGKDFHNPSVLFPKDFQKTHQLVSNQADKRRRREADRREAERERQRLLTEAAKEKEKIEWLSKYCKQFTNAEWHSGDFTIKPLITMEEFEQEAAHMHHCIRTYYGKINTLLVSIECRGKKCETAEIDLTGLGMIIQCRGVNNQPSIYHNKIVKILKELMSTFLARMDAEISTNTLPVLVKHYQYQIAI